VSLLDHALEPGSLSAVFQPVVDLGAASPSVYYVEGLVRGPKGTNLERPDVLFCYARRRGAEASMDRAAVRAILTAAESLPEDAAIGLNVHASSLAADLELLPHLVAVAREHGIALDRLLVEILEHGLPWDFGALRRTLAALRDLGVRIALDDIGTGQSNFLMMTLECRPDVLKVDRYLVGTCDHDPDRAQVLRHLARLADSFGARVVAEGVETGAELLAVRAAGIHLAQGYVFGRPQPAGASPAQDAREACCF